MRNPSLAKYLVYIIIIIVTSVLAGQLAIFALDRQDRFDCIKLQRQSQQFSGFFLSKYEKEKCEYVGIKIN